MTTGSALGRAESSSGSGDEDSAAGARMLAMDSEPGHRADHAGAEPPQPGLAITWLGHASVLVETAGQRAVFDPVLRRRGGPLVRVAPPVRPEAIAPVHLAPLSPL